MGDEIRLLSLSQNQNSDFELHNTHYFDQNDSLRMTSSHSRNGSSAISHNKGSGDSSDNLKNTQTENNYNLVQKERTSYDYSDGVEINGSSSNPTRYENEHLRGKKQNSKYLINRTSNVASSATNVVSTAPGSNRSSTDKMLLNGEDTSNSENTGNIGQNKNNNRGRISNSSITSNDSGGSNKNSRKNTFNNLSGKFKREPHGKPQWWWPWPWIQALDQMSTLGILLQVVPVLLFCIVGSIFAGHVLDNNVKTNAAYSQYPGLLILTPVIMNIKGNLEANLSTRLATIANTLLLEAKERAMEKEDDIEQYDSGVIDISSNINTNDNNNNNNNNNSSSGSSSSSRNTNINTSGNNNSNIISINNTRNGSIVGKGDCSDNNKNAEPIEQTIKRHVLLLLVQSMMMSIIVGLMVILVIILAELLGIHHPGLPINAGANNLTDAQSQGQILGGGSAEEGLKGGGMGVGVGGMFGKGNAVGSEAKLERTSILRFIISNTIVIMTTSYITSLVGALGVATLVTGVILVCYKFSGGKLDPDNVTAPLASTFGDVTTLLLMMGTSTAVSKLFGNGYTSSNGGIGNGFWWKIMGITAVLVTITGIFITIVLLMRILSSTAGTTDAKIGGIGIGIGGVGVGGGIGIGGGGGEYGYDYNILGNENARASTGQDMISGGNGEEEIELKTFHSIKFNSIVNGNGNQNENENENKTSIDSILPVQNTTDEYNNIDSSRQSIDDMSNSGNDINSANYSFYYQNIFIGWQSLLYALVTSSVAGMLLERYVGTYALLASLVPVFCGTGGNIAIVYASRISTSLHLERQHKIHMMHHLQHIQEMQRTQSARKTASGMDDDHEDEGEGGYEGRNINKNITVGFDKAGTVGKLKENNNENGNGNGNRNGLNRRIFWILLVLANLPVQLLFMIYYASYYMDYSKILPSSQTLQQNTNAKAGVGGGGVIFGKIQFVVLYLSACFVHVFVLLLTGLFAARATWRKKLESDYYVNPIIAGTGDMLGVLLLVIAFGLYSIL